MSTTGHYTRYINQANATYKNEWSDNCDTMHKNVYLIGVHRNCKYCDYPCKPETSEEKRIDLCPVKIGSFMVYHYAGNKTAFLRFDYDRPITGRWNYISLVEYTGNNAIQNVIKQSYDITPDYLVDMIFKAEFYNRSYMDYFSLAQERME